MPVGGRLDPEEALPARLGEVDERAPVGRRPGGRERQPVGPVRVLEAAPAGGHGRPPGLGRRPPLLVVAGEALPDEGPGEHHGHGGEDHREPGPGSAGAGVDRLPRHRHRRHRGQPPSPAPPLRGARTAVSPSPSRRRTRLGTGGVSPDSTPPRSPPAGGAAPGPAGPAPGSPARPGAVGAPRPPTTTVAPAQWSAAVRVAASPAGTPWTWPPPRPWPEATWRSRGRSWDGVARLAGSLTSRRARTGARAPRRWGRRGWPLTIALRVWNSPPPKGGWPSTANHRVAPSAHRSVAGLTGSASTCSGAM